MAWNETPSFLPEKEKCFGVLAQFVTHIVWVSHHVTFRGAEKDGRDRRWRRGAVWADNKLKRRGRKSWEKGKIKREGATGGCLMWGLFNAQWTAVTCTSACTQKHTKWSAGGSVVRKGRADTEPRVHLLRAAVLQQRLNQDVQISFRSLLGELLLARRTHSEERGGWRR